jgi:hypothetical protein
VAAADIKAVVVADRAAVVVVGMKVAATDGTKL